MKHEKRMEALPSYKEHRKNNMNPRQRKRFEKQIAKTRKLLYYMGIAQAHSPRLEGDDMVYWVVKNQQLLTRVLIVSGDKDFKQLINWDVNVMNPRGDKHIHSVFAFSAEHAGIGVPIFRDYMILIGDKSDDIPGYPGIGPVRAAAFLKKFGSIKAYLKSDDDYPGMIDKTAVKKLYKRNKLLMDLKWFNERYTKDIPITYYKGKQNPNFNDAKFLSICSRYGFKTMVSELFLRPFKKIGT
jgi:DNA polymerase-1